jgi:molybdopterin-guanine dinucleotide biosynthesis protein B
MRIVTVFGTTKSGKTTTIEALIRELIRRGHTVGSVKDIHFEQFAIDTPGTNTDRHRQAGANPVAAYGLRETDVLFARRLPLDELLSFYKQDYVILEGVREPGIPAILTVHSVDDIEAQDTPEVFALSGVGAAGIKAHKGRPAIDATADAAALADLVEHEAFRCPQEKQATLTVNGREIAMVPFVQAILKNAVLGVAKELRGVEPGRIVVEINHE